MPCWTGRPPGSLSSPWAARTVTWCNCDPSRWSRWPWTAYRNRRATPAGWRCVSPGWCATAMTKARPKPTPSTRCARCTDPLARSGGLQSGELRFVLAEFVQDPGRQRRADIADCEQIVLGGRGVSAATLHLAVERHLCPLAGSKFDVGRCEQLGRRDQSVNIDPRIGLAEIAFPHCHAGGLVGRTDRNDVVEAAGPQECRVQRVDRIGRAHQQTAVVLTKRRDEFQQLIGDAGFGGAGTGARDRDLLDLVDEQHQLIEFGQLSEHLPKRRRQPAVCRRGQPGRKQLYEGPAKPRRNTFGEAGFPAPSRPVPATAPAAASAHPVPRADWPDRAAGVRSSRSTPARHGGCSPSFPAPPSRSRPPEGSLRFSAPRPTATVVPDRPTARCRYRDDATVTPGRPAAPTPARRRSVRRPCRRPRRRPPRPPPAGRPGPPPSPRRPRTPAPPIPEPGFGPRSEWRDPDRRRRSHEGAITASAHGNDGSAVLKHVETSSVGFARVGFSPWQLSSTTKTSATSTPMKACRPSRSSTAPPSPFGTGLSSGSSR